MDFDVIHVPVSQSDAVPPEAMGTLGFIPAMPLLQPVPMQQQGTMTQPVPMQQQGTMTQPAPMQQQGTMTQPVQTQLQGAQPQIPAPGFQEELTNDMLFQNQGPVRQPEVYRIVKSALDSLYIPSVPEITKQVISYLEPKITQKLQSSKTSEPDLTSIITELINQNNAQIQEIAKLKTMNKTLERKYYIYNDHISKEKYRKSLLFIFSILVVVYFYFLKNSIDDINNLKPWDTDSKKELVNLSFVASLLIAASGFIFLYIALRDEELNVELAFN